MEFISVCIMWSLMLPFASYDAIASKQVLSGVHHHVNCNCMCLLLPGSCFCCLCRTNSPGFPFLDHELVAIPWRVEKLNHICKCKFASWFWTAYLQLQVEMEFNVSQEGISLRLLSRRILMRATVFYGASVEDSVKYQLISLTWKRDLESILT